MRASYLDASALVKLFKPEAETAALRAALDDAPVWLSSELVAVELRCAARRLDPGLLEQADAALSNVELVECTRAIQERAGMAFATPLRALDAIHAATALSVGEDIDAAYVYDGALGAALAAEGVTVTAPGR
ncbi:MAG: type II toxin-antitoxin system VapC family toxin [Thermoleophilaceae bacterium]